MTSVYLDQPPPSFPVVEFKEEQHLQLFLSSQPGAASVPSHAFFNTTHEDHRGRKVEESNHQVLDRRADKHVSLGRSIDHMRMLSSSSSQSVVTNNTGDRRVLLASSKREDGDYKGRGDGSSVKLLPPKIRLLQKAVNSSSCSGSDNKQVKVMMKFPPHQQCQAKEINSSSGGGNSYNHNNNNNSSIRVCSDCNTTTTPLWRSGPRGPKSLCNACGIRQRKARRAMAAAAAAAAANGTPVLMETASTTKTKLHNKEKKPRTSHSAQCKKMHKTPDHPSHQSQRKLSLKNIALSLSKNSAFQGVFPQDVEEAAILLMELSCGFIHG